MPTFWEFFCVRWIDAFKNDRVVFKFWPHHFVAILHSPSKFPSLNLSVFYVPNEHDTIFLHGYVD